MGELCQFGGHAPPIPSLWALLAWLDSWAGIGRIAVGMAHQGFDLQLTRYDERGWRATFYTTGMEHSPTSATGTAWGADAVARDAAGGMGRIQTGHLSGQTSCRVITSVNPLGTRSPDRQSVWPRGCQT